MLNWGAKVGRGNLCDIGQNGFQIVCGHVQRVNGRRGIVGKGFGDVHNLREGRVRVERVERLKPEIPILKGAQDRKRWGGSDGLHAVDVADNMATPAMLQRKNLSLQNITRELHHLRRGILGEIRRKHNGILRLKGFNRVFADLGIKPVAKLLNLGAGRFRRAAEKPNVVWPLENRLARVIGADRHLGPSSGWDNGHPQPVFQRETRQDMAQHPGFHQGVWGRKRQRLVLRGRCADSCEYNQKNCRKTPITGKELVS